MKTLKTTFIAFIAVTIMSCSPLFDQVTYDKTNEIKTTTLELMDKSDTSFTDSEAEVTSLKNQMNEMVTYESGKKNNKITQKMWELIGSEKHFVGSYLKLWEDKGSLSPALKDPAKQQIEEAFNLMIGYEEEKDKTKKNALKEIINGIIQ